jgi:hypothetical protein
MKYIGKKHRQCENADIRQLQTTVITDRSTLECKNFKSPIFPYINYALLYQHIPENSRDAQSIKKLLETFFKDIKSRSYIQSKLHDEAIKIAERNNVNLNDLIEGDLDFYL